MSYLDKFLGQLGAEDILFGREIAMGEISTFIKMAALVAKEIANEDGNILIGQIVDGATVAATAESGGNTDPESWPDAVKEKVAKLINRLLPGIMFEINEPQFAETSLVSPRMLFIRQKMRHEFHHTIMNLINDDDNPLHTLMVEEFTVNPGGFDILYDGIWKTIDHIQGQFDSRQISPEDYNRAMEPAASLVNLVEKLNKLYFLPSGEERYPLVIKAVLGSTALAVAHQWKASGVVQS